MPTVSPNPGKLRSQRSDRYIRPVNGARTVAACALQGRELRNVIGDGIVEMQVSILDQQRQYSERLRDASKPIDGVLIHSGGPNGSVKGVWASEVVLEQRAVVVGVEQGDGERCRLIVDAVILPILLYMALK